MQRLFLAISCLFLIATTSKLYAQTGTVDYVPNGSFEYISKPDNQLGLYQFRYGKYSLFWRQFHRWTVPNEVGTMPDWPIDRDRVYNPLVMYEPVTCSSSDLFSQHLQDCVPGTPGSLLDIPNNNFGYEPIRPGSMGQKYAGLYNRLNGIRVKQGVTPIAYEAFGGNPATDWWREYLEVELLCPLVAGRQYTLSFWASLGEVSESIIQIEARVSEQPYHTHPLDDCDIVTDFDANQTSRVRAPVTEGLQGYTLQSPYLFKNGGLPNGGWVKVEDTFTATGGEKYLTIGYFDNVYEPSVTVDDDCLPHYNHPPLTTNRVYVYVDDVRLKSAGEVECICTQQIELEPIIPAPQGEEGNCCFRVIYKRSADASGCNSCTIESIVGKPIGSEQEVLNWSSTISHGPITGDGIPVEIGMICVDEFFYNPPKEFKFELYGSSGQQLCQSVVSVNGCVDQCNCANFAESVSISTVSQGNNPCCFRLKLDARFLSGCAQIASIQMFKTNGVTRSEITSASYNGLVPSDFYGYLYTFCPVPLPTFVQDDKVSVVFKDASGDVICEVELPTFSCECDCNSSTAEIHYVPVVGPDNTCCYNVVLRNPSECKIALREVWIRGSEFQGLGISGSSGWSSSLSYVGSQPSGVRFTKPGSPTVLYPEQEILIGTICPADCIAGDLSVKLATVTFSVNGVECNAKTVQTHLDATCLTEFDCDDFTVSIVMYPVYNTQCCSYGVEAQVDVCPVKYQGLYLEVAGFPQHPVSSSSNDRIATWVCQPNSGSITVKLKRADGTVLCTKSVLIPPCNSPNNLMEPSNSSNRNESVGYNTEVNVVRSLVVKRHSRLEDVELAEKPYNWDVFNTDGVVVASSAQEVHKSNSVVDAVSVLPVGVYVVSCLDTATGRVIVRRVHVQP